MKWDKRDRFSKLANVLYPHMADKGTRTEMEQLARNEGKKLSDPKLLKDHQRGCMSPLGGVAVQQRRK